eukprot:2588151-Pyramimonas_sp.AAC.1
MQAVLCYDHNIRRDGADCSEVRCRWLGVLGTCIDDAQRAHGTGQQVWGKPTWAKGRGPMAVVGLSVLKVGWGRTRAPQ